MNVLRLRLPVVVAAALAMPTAAALGSSCSEQAIPDCGVPSPGEIGTDGGADPCHCDPAPALNIEACPCAGGTSAQVDIYDSCVATYWVEKMFDGGGGG